MGTLYWVRPCTNEVSVDGEGKVVTLDFHTLICRDFGGVENDDVKYLFLGSRRRLPGSMHRKSDEDIFTKTRLWRTLYKKPYKNGFEIPEECER